MRKYIYPYKTLNLWKFFKIKTKMKTRLKKKKSIKLYRHRKFKKRKKLKHYVKIIPKRVFLRKCIFLKKTLNNFFLTFTNIKGEVIFSYSYGKIKIFTKKRRKSRESYKD